MKQNLKDFLFNLAISMLCGVFVGITQMIVKNINIGTIEELIMFSVIGGVIGTISRFVFIYMVGIKQKSAMASIYLCIYSHRRHVLPAIYLLLFYL